MQIISAREFRANQTNILRAARDGQSVTLTSRVGNFKIVPVTEEESVAQRIQRGVEQVRLIREGKLKSYTIEEALDEL